ncbi:MAG: phosphoribosyltransferase family protein [Bacteroidales bacterium]|nr:phosphoribosyltransferase family protein [Bacteroidales bacterium]
MLIFKELKSRIVYDFLQLVFPRVCLLCYDTLVVQERFLCLQCKTRLPYSHYWEEKDNPAAQLFWGRVPVEWVIPFLHFTKNGVVQHLIHEIKYNKRHDLAEYLGTLFGNVLNSSSLKMVDGIVPVPLHASRLLERGYNQSEKIAQGISQSMNIPLLSNVIERRVWKSSQTKRNRYERWQNVKDAFQLVNREAIAGKHIMLVDDVLTTGATLEACALKILEAERVSISIVTLAKA